MFLELLFLINKSMLFANGVMDLMSNVEIGDRIRELRELKKLIRDELADLAEISPKFMYEIEMGKKGFSAKTLIKLSKALGVSCECIMLGSGTDIQRKKLASVLSNFNDSEINMLDILIQTVHEKDTQ